MAIKVILASASPRRKELLRSIYRHFTVAVSQIDEAKIQAPTPLTFARRAALAKALDVAQRFEKGIVIGADTIVVLKNKILGKPKNKQDAINMLKALSGTQHKVITGLALVDSASGKKTTRCVTTLVKMKRLSDKQIKDYVATGSPLDKAGGYGIQEIEDPFIEYIKGDYNNVVGLPVDILKRMLGRIDCRDAPAGRLYG